MKPITLLIEQLLVCSIIMAFLSGFIFFQPVGEPIVSNPVPLKGGIPKIFLMVVDGLRQDHVLTLHSDIDDGGSASIRYPSRMPYVASLLNYSQSNLGHQHTMKSRATAYDVMTFTPTVTAPRLLSLVSGSIPGFMSIASNFGTSEVTQDNIVTKWKNSGRRIKFFGDDTWSAMFPGHFVFADPVSSFFVSDYTEVDRNVSRHLRSLFNGSEELSSWDVAILHYLGLDHIGHSHGSKHRLIDDKLTQMSNVVRAANLKLEASGCNYLILVCGDHGMLDEGGHGGSSYEELHTAAVFMGPRVESRKSREQLMIRQVDLSSTLAVLSGVSVPASSVGVPLLSLLSPLVDAYDLLQLYKSEAKRLLHILEAASLPAGDASALMVEAEWLEAQNYDFLLDLENRAAQQTADELADNRTKSCVGPQAGRVRDSGVMAHGRLMQIVALYEKTCRKASDILVNKMKTYDLPVLAASAAVLFLFVSSRMLLLLSGLSTSAVKGATLGTVACCAGVVLVLWSLMCGMLTGRDSTSICDARLSVTWLLLPPAIYSMLLFRTTVTTFKAGKAACKPEISATPFKLASVVLVVGVVAHTLSLFGSSFVEEEHQTFYFFLTSALLVVLLCCVRCCFITFGGQQAVVNLFTSTSSEFTDDNEAPRDPYDAMQLQRDEQFVRLRGSYDHLYGHSSLVTSNLDSQVETADFNLAGALTTAAARTIRKKSEIYQQMRFSCYARASLGLLLSLILFRVIRTWNSSGDKWRHLPDTAEYFTTFSLVSQAACHMVGLALLVLCDVVCLPAYMLGLLHILSYHFPFGPDDYGKELAPVIIYWSSLVLLAYGVARIFLLQFIFRRKHPGYRLRRCAVLLLGLPPSSQVRTLYANGEQCQDGRLPALGVDSKNNWKHSKLTGSIMKEENFRFVVQKYNSTSYLLPQLLRYARCSLTLVWLLLQERSNVPLCCLLMIQASLSSSSLHQLTTYVGRWSLNRRLYPSMPSSHAALVMLWTADAFFFSQGNNNSLSSIKVAAGFTGVNSYHAYIHASLILLHTFGAPLLTLLRYLQERISTNEMNGTDNACDRSPWQRTMGFGWWPAASTAMLAWWHLRLLTVCACVLNVLVQRDHIFIWSVYMPKLVYQCCHLVLMPLIHIFVISLATCAT